MENPADSKLGEFRILSRIKVGSGTQGAVYKAVCEGDSFPLCPRGTIVALKSMPVPAESEKALEKLRLNVETLAGLGHPNVVRYLGCFSAQISFSEQFIVIQEYLEGESLASRLASSRTGLDSDEALRVVKGMVAGLAAAVGRGIIHRDVKPANVFLCADGSVKLIDFEVSRRADGSVTASSGNMVGSYDYMAPEFANPSFCGDERSDIFSAGVVMHEVFTGSVPYQRGTAEAGKLNLAFFERWARDADGALVNGGCRISYRIERVVSHAKPVLVRALAADRDERFATFGEFSKALSGVRFRELKKGDVRYRILQFIGKGGFGEVFKARQNGDGKIVAVKHLLKPDYAARFYREARIMSELRDPCFVRFLNFIAIDRPGAREAFLVMEFLPNMPGNSLRDAIRRSAGGGIGFKEAIEAFIRYAHGLSVLHGRGIYHRDIKPSNLYFPEDHPELAAIMDLGIARDENGTKTNGQVPGTLDYMPPETAFGGTRGDAAMDIYALGLCLYEALAGRKAFPVLPSGSAAFAQFFRRAREMTSPTFDDERVTSRPELLQLLLRMTDPDCAKRLADAGKVEFALRRLLDPDVAVPADAGETQAEETVTRSDVTMTEATLTMPTTAEGDANTVETRCMDPAQVAEMAKGRADTQEQDKAVEVPVHEKTTNTQKPEKPKKQKKPKKPKKRRDLLAVRRPSIISYAAAAAGLTAFGFFCVPIMCEWFNGYLTGQTFDQTPAKLVVSDASGLGADDFYGDDAMSIEQADALRDRWLADRRPPVLSKEEYARAVQLLAERREQRIVRERLDEERSRIDSESKVVIQTYREEGVAAGDQRRDEWLHAWSGAARKKVEQAAKAISAARTERLALDAARALVPEAEAEAGTITRNYLIDDLAISDENADAWRNRWRERLPEADFMRIDGMFVDAHKRAHAKMDALASRAVLDSCRSLVEMTMPAETRMSRLVEAETLLKSEIASGRVADSDAEGILSEIAKRRLWTVFEVDNRSGIDLDIDGTVVPHGTTKPFVYTNDVPADLAATCAGYEPFVFGPQLNGRNIRLLPEYFTMLRVPMTLETQEKGVTCRVDGLMVRGGKVHLMPGTHECVYSRPDWRSQSLPFRVEPDRPAALPNPGPWKETDGLAALVAAEVAVEGGDWDRAAAILKFADVKGEDGLKRKTELRERIERRGSFLKRVDAAAAAYMDMNWMDVLSTYSGLVADGYVLTDEDRERIERSESNVRGRIKIQRQAAENKRSAVDVAKADAESDSLDRLIKTIRKSAP